MTFWRKDAAIRHRRSGKAFEWPPASCSTQTFAFTLAATAASGTGTISTVAAAGGGAFRHHLWGTRLRRGKSQSREQARKQLAELAGLLPVMELPLRAGEFYGSMRAALAAEGAMIGNNDLWIAAHAKAAALILITNNEREFRRIQGLEIQNWAD